MEQTSYQFTEKEKLYFNRLNQEYQAGVSAGLRLIMTQQDLQGQWRVKADMSGLELPQQALPSSSPDPVADLEKQINGVA